MEGITHLADLHQTLFQAIKLKPFPGFAIIIQYWGNLQAQE
jgi:hypothetical protein